jgi:hypothetical protein
MGMLSGVLSATSWVVVGFAQGRMGDHVNQTHSYDFPLIITGLSPLVGLIAFLALVAVTNRSGGNER